MDCLFCKIIAGDIPCNKVYEDEHTLAFLDISPINYGHTLVVPKKHFKNHEEIDDETLAHIFASVKKVGKSLKDNYDVEGYNVGVNNDPVAGQIIPHYHAHVIPRSEKDGLQLWPGGKYADGEAEELAKKIKIN